MKMTDAESNLVDLFNEVYEREWELAAESAADRNSAIKGPADEHATLMAIRAIAARLAADQQKGGGEPVAWLEPTTLNSSHPADMVRMRASGYAPDYADWFPVYTTPQPSIPAPAQQGDAIQEAAARQLYVEHTSNHPTIHCNRFPAWGELSPKAKQEWLDKVVEADTGIAEVDRAIGRLMSSDPTFDDCNNAAALLRKLAHPPHADHKEPQG